MRSLKFNTLLKQTIWGGERIIPYKKLSKHLPNVGESWDISDIPGKESLVSDGDYKGQTLSSLITQLKTELVGTKCYNTFGDHFPLLIKFIDATSDLSIQVHPNDALAQREGYPCGKTEMWYLIDASDHATLISGLKEPLTKDSYLEAVHQNSLLDKLHTYAVHPGDCFYIPSGQVHSIGAGVFLLEVQQTSDITYRIYDYDRTDINGKKRELHTEQALEAIDFSSNEDHQVKYTHAPNQNIPLVKCPYFTASLNELTKPITKDYTQLDSFVIWIVFEGECSFTNEGNETDTLCTGESVLIPACTQTMSIVPATKGCKFIEIFYE
ncbi:MAG: type I phosphomannose isomerase catalytic subunit [Bacteroidaceae bacterium]